MSHVSSELKEKISSILATKVTRGMLTFAGGVFIESFDCTGGFNPAELSSS